MMSSYAFRSIQREARANTLMFLLCFVWESKSLHPFECPLQTKFKMREIYID